MPNVYNQLAHLAAEATNRILPGHIYCKRRNGFTRRRATAPKESKENRGKIVLRIPRAHPILPLLKVRGRFRVIKNYAEKHGYGN